MKRTILLAIATLLSVAYAREEYSYQMYKAGIKVAEERYIKSTTVKVVIGYYAGEAKEKKCVCVTKQL